MVMVMVMVIVIVIVVAPHLGVPLRLNHEARLVLLLALGLQAHVLDGEAVAAEDAGERSERDDRHEVENLRAPDLEVLQLIESAVVVPRGLLRVEVILVAPPARLEYSKLCYIVLL